MHELPKKSEQNKIGALEKMRVSEKSKKKLSDISKHYRILLRTLTTI